MNHRRPFSLALLALCAALWTGCGELTFDEGALLAAAGGADPVAIGASDIAEMELLARRYTLEVVDAEETEAILDEIRALSPTDALIFRAAVNAVLLGVPLDPDDLGDMFDMLLLDEASDLGASFIDLTEAEIMPALGDTSGGLGQVNGALCDAEAACALVQDWPLAVEVGDCRAGCYGASSSDRVTDDPNGCAGGSCAVRLTFSGAQFALIDGVTAATDCVLDHAQGALPARLGERLEVRLTYAAVRKCGLPDELATEYLKGRVLAR